MRIHVSLSLSLSLSLSCLLLFVGVTTKPALVTLKQSTGMNLDVIDATAEALPLEMLNKVNKELTAQLSRNEAQLEEKARGIDDQKKRLQFMKEHLGNVRAEIVNTQSLVESKRRELMSEENMRKLMERECGRLQQKKTELERDEEGLRDKMTSLQNQIFQGNLKIEELKEAMDFNQEELEQWDEARRQKEEDELAIAQYSKQDEAKLKQMQLTIDKLIKKVAQEQKQLDEEILATQHTQVELDRCADEYRKIHEDRGGLLDEWENVVRTIADRDNAIQVAAQQYAEGTAWVQQREDMKRELQKELDDANEETQVINYTIEERERQAQQYRDAIPPVAQQVQEIEDEVSAMRERVARALRDKRSLLTQLQDMKENLVRRAAELVAIEKRREEAASRLDGEMDAAADMQLQTELITQLLADADKTSKNLEKDIEQLKKQQFSSNQGLAKVRESQNTLLAHISGAQAQGKNLAAKVNQLDSESFTQQGVLYNIEFSVQQMEKRVNRAKGERTEDERRELHEKINLLQSTHDELEQQYKVLDQQVKRVREELRRSKMDMEKLEGTKARAAERIMTINLEVGHSEQEMRKLEQQREDELVQIGTIELQLSRLKRQLQQKSERLVDLEQRKAQLAADVQERETEIAVHQSMLKMEAKLAEEERRALQSELQERLRSLKAIRNRHEVLVGRMDPAQARLSQAQLVIASAKEREDLQYRGDSLDTRIKRMEKEILKLEKTISVIKASNSNYKQKFAKVSEGDEAVQTKKILQAKFRELKTLMSKKSYESNDYELTRDNKRAELEELRVAREQMGRMVEALQRECGQANQEVAQSREATERYERAYEKASAVVAEEMKRDIALQENRDRLSLIVRRLLDCTQKAGEEVVEVVKTAVMAANLPLPSQ
ncbi:coiled-coil domain containing 39 [Strigomonas culicis]|uniref:Coiled-coil domain containing 39 n=2 Tax=Strigomonas culicis TaxID=28005 RepID=S9UI33_9TRYP|nr:coiled-coil domain containing 39 [Strigomonas culicis]|eukprot:EPY28578.1 coiled-coil domain containing 39 [Strigomonas culicis]